MKFIGLLLQNLADLEEFTLCKRALACLGSALMVGETFADHNSMEVENTAYTQ